MICVTEINLDTFLFGITFISQPLKYALKFWSSKFMPCKMVAYLWLRNFLAMLAVLVNVSPCTAFGNANPDTTLTPSHWIVNRNMIMNNKRTYQILSKSRVRTCDAQSQKAFLVDVSVVISLENWGCHSTPTKTGGIGRMIHQNKMINFCDVWKISCFGGAHSTSDNLARYGTQISLIWNISTVESRKKSSWFI